MATTMSDTRFIYADPGLHGQAGHHFNAAASMLDELNRRGIPARILAFAEVDQALRNTLGASPFFRHNLYWLTDQDPLCGPAFAFHTGAQAMREDLHRLTDLKPTDIVFVPWALPAQLWGIVQWLGDLPPERQPLTILNFLHVPEVMIEWRDNKLSMGVPDYRIEPSAMFLRFSAKHVRSAFAHRIRLGCTFSEGVAVLTAVLGLPVRPLPAPQNAAGSIRRRSAAGPLTIGMIGHQRGYAKGVQHMPELVGGILQSAPTARVLIQDCSNDLLPEVAAVLVRMSNADKRISLIRGPLDAAQWASMLNGIDLLICPYSQTDYRLSSSGAVSYTHLTLPTILRV